MHLKEKNVASAVHGGSPEIFIYTCVGATLTDVLPPDRIIDWCFIITGLFFLTVMCKPRDRNQTSRLVAEQKKQRDAN